MNKEIAKNFQKLALKPFEKIARRCKEGDQSYTKIPNIVLDFWMAVLPDKAFKMFCQIFRETNGYQKPSSHISYSQFMTGKKDCQDYYLSLGSGIGSNRTVIKHLRLLLDLELIEKQGKGGRYGLEYAPRIGALNAPIQKEIGAPVAETSALVAPLTSAPGALHKRKKETFTKERNDDLKNLRDEFVKERGYEPFDETELLVFKSQKAYREMK